jgi:hypothetical protein
MKIVLIILAVIAVTAVLLFWGGRNTTTTVVVNPAPPVAEVSPLEKAGTTADTATNPLFSRTVVPRPRAAETTDTNTPPDWEDKLAQALTDEGTDAEISARLLALYPQLPPEGQAELAPHLVATLPDADYASAGNLLTNATTPEAVLDVLLTDLLDRPATTQLNTLLAVARNTGHPKAEDAREMLVALMEQDHGKDWAAWAKKISEWLASHPE